MTEKEIITVLEEAKSLLSESTQVLVYFKYNENNEVVDTLTTYTRNECAEQNNYYLEYIFSA